MIKVRNNNEIYIPCFFILFFRENDIVKEILCEPCITENIQVSASFFCKTCEDPEPLCDICARHHTKQKLSKNHELCEDITDFRKR